jgi:hypothetical protein
MPYQNIQAEVTLTQVQTIKEAVASIRGVLPFLVTLTVDERRKIFKTGPDSLSFVQNSLTAARNNPAILPGSFTINGFESDVNLFGVLTDVGTVVNQLASDLDDTRLAVGGEAMTGAKQVYNYVKAAVASAPGLKPVADQLGERFQRASAAKPPTPPA